MDIEEAEVLFARKLADCEPGIRKKAFSQLRRWISSKMRSKETFDRDDLITLWKGLYYCMWMQDKPLLHEELADRLCSLADEFRIDDQHILYLDTFLETIGREWFSIDRWRVDKFMMLFRRIFRHSLTWLKSRDWDDALWRRLVDMYSKTVWAADSDSYPEELKCHFASMYLDELDAAGVFDRSQQDIFPFLDIYIKLLISRISNLFFGSVTKEIFDTMLVDYSENFCPKSKRRKGEIVLVQPSEVSKIDYGGIADAVFEAGKTKSLKNNRRNVIYKLAKQFRAAANGEDPFNTKIDLGKSIDETEIEKAALDLLKETSVKLKKRKQTDSEENDLEQAYLDSIVKLHSSKRKRKVELTSSSKKSKKSMKHADISKQSSKIKKRKKKVKSS